MINQDWIGEGLKFPDSFKNGNTLTNKYEDRISQSIYMILSTPIGTRFFLPSFGSRLHELIFEPNDMILQDMLEYYTLDALELWEKRIKVLKVTAKVKKYDNTVPVVIYYQIKNTNIQQNYVYPFQRNIMELK